MAIIKRPIRKTLLYLAFFISVVSALTTKIIAGDSQNNLSNLEKKAKSVFSVVSGSIISSIAKGQTNCWSPPYVDPGCVDPGCGCGSSDGTTGGSTG